jgi:hypothetical protein
MKNTGDSTKSEGTNNYAQNKTSKNRQKLPCWRGELEGTINTLKQRAQKITRETKLPKIAKKLPSWRGELEGTINTPSELEGAINTPAEGTNNYMQTKTSKKRQNYMRNKTSKISK